MTHLVNTAITTLQQLGLVFSAIHRSSECVIYATLDFARYCVFRQLTGASQAPGNDTTWELHLAEFIVHRRG